ncbi:hypothetical protein BDK51DRAFT_32301 [Blyttiomyces helicus]|uniref:Peptidase A1 domain-containing protein n=1 Tax=Blyttiomyces helicus TaxID=388810 RepID=A0A4P9W4U3_9FUNG|nr:hypothetical protein BDK51DRAFT_32301 [Blyttiomyces helicus]|eukprot:RKO86942.1 hypothetical protein BDK51DRAFT_32301 [Blyttiomyces helicus]
MKCGFFLLSTLATASPLVQAGNFSTAPHPVSVPIFRRPSDASPEPGRRQTLRSPALYYTTVSVGNGQLFRVNLDTGSSDFWVAGSRSAPPEAVPSTSSTDHSTGLTFSDRYGTGTSAGDVYFGPYTLAGATAHKGATNESGFVIERHIQGLLALAFPFGKFIRAEASPRKSERF